MRRPGRRGLEEWLIGACGAWLIGLGVYFMLLRPPLLPEDARFIGTSLAQVRATMPGLEGWLHRVFAVMGGFMSSTGVLTVLMASVAMPARMKGTSWVLAVTGALTVVLMSATNFALDSDFKWILLVPALVWFAGLVLHVASQGRAP